ncbi:MAG: response regulator [Cytophagales bacterium]|uniref:Response regulatory domain-containing protein n=1 Tax=Algoriphagus taiwanensis TaxID=1445656 RepID=A0ABQ6PY28_9BACT|nr:MAG: response regulator [Cytophagales bacterium]GMQ32532.1 hypothetical protein Ataiwa_08040 [Algoriphagus taiwanensis]
MSKNKKVLVGEDSSIIINLTKNVLAFENYEMKAARNGQLVLDLLDKEEFDLILLDITMPVMDGVECIRKIRTLDDPQKKSLPVIAISGNVNNLSPEQFRKLGFDDFIQKPLDYDQVLATVKKHLS